MVLYSLLLKLKRSIGSDILNLRIKLCAQNRNKTSERSSVVLAFNFWTLWYTKMDRWIDKTDRYRKTKPKPNSPKNPLSLALKNTVICLICVYQGIVTSVRADVARNSLVVTQSCRCWAWAREAKLEHISWLASSPASSEMSWQHLKLLDSHYMTTCK